jgi:hypothetical protein
MKSGDAPIPTWAARLRDDPGHARSLAAALLDDLVGQPVATLVDAEALAGAFAAGLRATADLEDLEAWAEARASAALKRARERFDGRLDAQIPEEVVASIRRLAARPFRADPALARSVLRHRRVRTMLRAGLQNLLTDFGRSLLSAVPGGGKGGALSGLMGMAKGMASALTQELDRHLEGRVRDFVDDSLDRGVEKWARKLATREQAERMAEVRTDLLDVLLEQPVRHYLDQPRAADVALLTQAAVAEVRAIAAWADLEAEIEAAIRAELDELGEASVADLLDGSGLLEAWRPEAEKLLATHLGRFFASEAFGAFAAKI